MSLLLPYQSAWVRDKSRLKICEKARQVGMSWAAAYSVVRETCNAEALLDTLVSSRDESLAADFKSKCNAWAGVLSVTVKDLGLQVMDDSKDISAYVLHFQNNKKIFALSSNPDAQAGRAANRLLDEFALHPNPKQLYDIAYPGIQWGGSLSIISTHRGADNFFNQLIEEIKHKGNPKGFSLHRVTLGDALDQGLLAKLKTKLADKLDHPVHNCKDDADYFNLMRSGCSDESSFMQEYMCVPENDEDSFLPYELIETCIYEPNVKWETDLADAKGRLYLGVDIGRVKDLTCIICVEEIGDVFYLRKLIELYKTPFAVQESILYPLLALPQMRRCCIDQTGMGMQFAERAAHRWGEYQVEGVTLTNQTKQDLAYPLKEAFQKKTIRIPDLLKFKNDLHSVKKETTSAGNIRFAGNSDDSHADRFWALALALHAGKRISSIGSSSYTPMKVGSYQHARF